MADMKIAFTWIFLQSMCVVYAYIYLENGEIDYECSMVSASAASRRFSYSLYKTAAKLSGHRRNIFLPPLAVGMSLSSLTYGAYGWSRVQIFRVLEQRNKSEEAMDEDCILHAYHSDRYNRQFVLEDFEEENDTAVLRTATRLYGDKTFTFRDDFVQSTGRYGIEMAVAPFNESRKLAERQINRWVNEQTGGNIVNIIQPNFLTPDAMLVITCALFFKGTWDISFVNEGIGPFYLYRKRYREIEFMASRDPVRYLSSNILQAELLELPYTSPDGSNIDARLIVILPRSNVSIRTTEDALNDTVIQALLQQDLSMDIRIHIPKFSLFGEHKLKFFLKRMGVREIFHGKKSRLYGAVSEEDEKRRIHVTHIQHKAKFEIDEFGTQGSVTRLDPRKDHVANATQEWDFRVDRPFLFLIYDKFTDTIIYIGRLADPERRVT
uniref:leukocyte elastase inhibitor-like n=1 Tax=Styela clava TaxID=7725 RepID=UPI00193AC4EA|nr:leukocyte elastase inhibitor-like [Styela clava]